jgi:tetratricopeptide (TPR) repeat protein
MAQDYGRYKELTEDLTKWFPNDGTITYRRGVVSLCDGQIDAAMRGLRASIKQKGAPKAAAAAANAAKDVNQLYPRAQRQIERNETADANATVQQLRVNADRYCWAGSVLSNSVLVLEIQVNKLVKQPSEMLAILNENIDRFPDLNELYLERGDLNIELNDYDAAIFDFTTVQRRAPSQRAQEGLRKATDLKKQASFVDFYAILGVRKGASSEEAKTAYKKLARQWHPDRFSDPVKKKEAEEMMKTLNKALDVLGDRDIKRRYDAGEDPDAPEVPHGNPFGGFPFQFAGGGFQFHFGGGGQHFEFHF